MSVQGVMNTRLGEGIGNTEANVFVQGTAFLLAAAVVRWSGSPRGVAAFAYAGYQLWLAVWIGGVNVFTRILMAFPIGLLTAFAVVGILTWAIGKAAIDELG